MASTLQVVANSRTPESVVLLLANDGVADMAPLELAKAALLAQLLPGPLYELISRTATLSNLNPSYNGPTSRFIRFYEIAGGLDSLILPPNTTLVLRFSGTGMEYSIFDNTAGGSPSSILVELRLAHSNER